MSEHVWRYLARSFTVLIEWCPLCGCVRCSLPVAGGQSWLAPGQDMMQGWLLEEPRCSRTVARKEG